METIHERCAGVDVHSRELRVCIRRMEGGRLRQEVRSFGTTTRELLALGDWLKRERVSIVAMESTGVYWKPVWNVLDGMVELMLVNAQHIKKVPGRKTDTQDCQWIAQLLQHGLLRASFVPERPQRELRDLTRARSQVVAQCAQVCNRVQKVLEDANIKLTETVSDVLGASGRDMVRALIAGQSDPEVLAELARGRMRSKRESLKVAFEGRINEHHRFMLEVLMQELSGLEAVVARLEKRIEELTASMEVQIQSLCGIPGISRTVAVVILAEVGKDMSRFADAAHLASWAGICPGNHESGGKRKSGRTCRADRWLKSALSQAAWAATHTRTYFRAQYHRIARRRGKKRALLAVAHSLLRVVYHVLRDGTAFNDLGMDWFDRRNSERLQNHLVRRLESLGYQVHLARPSEAA